MRMGPREVVWITGAAGRMGQAIGYHLDNEKYTVYTTDAELDVCDLSAVNHYADTIRPDFIINCAGIASKDHAHAHPIDAYRVNALGARNLAIASQGVGATIVHLSTDDLFPPDLNHPVNEFDPVCPVHVYGKSKAAGERLVAELNPRHIIVRSSWVYTALPDDYLARLIKAARSGEEVRVPADQFASPTSSYTYARFIIACMESGEFGTFHASCEGVCSRYEFVRRAFELAGAPVAGLVGTHIAADAYRIDLNNLMIKMTGIFDMPSWEDDLAHYLELHGLTA